MAHYAFLDDANTVVSVITGKDEYESSVNWEEFYQNDTGLVCKRTSYRTRNNQHPEGTPFRGNYAGIGYTYDETLDVFLPPKPYESWVLNLQDCDWEPPVAMPDDGMSYTWDELTQSWVFVSDPGDLLSEPA